jgi:putative addiction module antidote
MDTLTLTVRKIGNSLGFILPKEVVQLLQVQEGETLSVTRSPDGVRITPYDPQFEHKIEIARSVMSRYKNALRELAK